MPENGVPIILDVHEDYFDSIIEDDNVIGATGDMHEYIEPNNNSSSQDKQTIQPTLHDLRESVNLIEKTSQSVVSPMGHDVEEPNANDMGDVVSFEHPSTNLEQSIESVNVEHTKIGRGMKEKFTSSNLD